MISMQNLLVCIYGCVCNKCNSYQNKTLTQNQQCEQRVYRRLEHKTYKYSISQVTNVEILKKERKSKLSKIIIIITKKESEVPTPAKTSIAVYTNMTMS